MPRVRGDTAPRRRRACLSEWSTVTLLAGALGVSALLWLTILAVT